MLTHFAISLPGRNHESKHIPCQDTSLTKVVKLSGGMTTVVIGIVADGVGTAKNSDVGSTIATHEAAFVLEHELAKLATLSVENTADILSKAFRSALSHIHLVSEAENNTLTDYDTTLTALIYDGNKLYFGHCGDGGIVAFDKNGGLRLLTTRMKGEESNSVVPLRGKCWEFGTNENVSAAILMTDGLLDLTVDNKAMQNRVYYPFFHPILDPISSAEDEASHKAAWEAFLSSDAIKSRVGDDLSIAFVANSDRMQETQKNASKNFKISTWEAEAEKRKNELAQLHSRKTEERNPHEEVAKDIDNDTGSRSLVESAAVEKSVSTAKSKFYSMVAKACSYMRDLVLKRLKRDLHRLTGF